MNVHVVQQKQGRVRPTMDLKGTSINDETDLEREADTMAKSATHLPVEISPGKTKMGGTAGENAMVGGTSLPIQRMVVKPGNTLATVEDVRAFAFNYRYQLTLGRQENRSALNQENPNANVTIPQFLFKLGIKQQRSTLPSPATPTVDPLGPATKKPRVDPFGLSGGGASPGGGFSPSTVGRLPTVVPTTPAVQLTDDQIDQLIETNPPGRDEQEAGYVKRIEQTVFTRYGEVALLSKRAEISSVAKTAFQIAQLRPAYQARNELQDIRGVRGTL